MSTSLSAGLIVYDLLSKSEAVMSIATRVFPVIVQEDEDVRMPYVCYHRERMDQMPVKGHGIGSDTVRIVVACYASDYAESIELAEAVRTALDGKFDLVTVDGLTLRSSLLIDAQDYADDEGNFVQELSFNLKI